MLYFSRGSSGAPPVEKVESVVSGLGDVAISQEGGSSYPSGILPGRTLPYNPRRAKAIREVGRHGGATVKVLPGGWQVVAHGAGPESTKACVGGGSKRDIIRGFSQRSRKRLLRRLMGVDWRTASFFLTLTYHDEWPVSWRGWKSDLALFLERMAYHYGGLLGCVWRLEVLSRKSGTRIGELAPHYHLGVFFSRDVDLARLRVRVGEAWNEVVAPGDLQHAQAGTQVQKARNTSGPKHGKLMHYLAKYMCKRSEQLACGRQWSFWGCVPTRSLGGIVLSESAYQQVIRNINELGERCHSWYLSAISPLWRGFSILGDGLHFVDTLLAGIEDGVVYV